MAEPPSPCGIRGTGGRRPVQRSYRTMEALREATHGSYVRRGRGGSGPGACRVRTDGAGEARHGRRGAHSGRGAREFPHRGAGGLSDRRDRSPPHQFSRHDESQRVDRGNARRVGAQQRPDRAVGRVRAWLGARVVQRPDSHTLRAAAGGAAVGLDRKHTGHGHRSGGHRRSRVGGGAREVPGPAGRRLDPDPSGGGDEPGLGA